jgi:hypothetical protein
LFFYFNIYVTNVLYGLFNICAFVIVESLFLV